MNDAEARTQRGGHQARARRGANQREAVQNEGMNPRARALPDHQVNAVVLHRRVQNFLDGGNQAMDFVEKKYFLLLKRRQDRGQIALAFQQRAGTGLDHHAQFAGDDLRERRFAESRRAVEQHVIQRFAAAARRLDGDFDIFLHARLANVIGKSFRSNAGVNARVFIQLPRR